MHVYMRWYEDGQPKGNSQRMDSESEARTAVLARFPMATFSERSRTVHQPGSYLAGIDEVIYAWPGARIPGLHPVAEILFPTN